MLEQLEWCQKALCNFLEEKRAKFPRFYFIGDDDLLEILGQAQNPAVIQAHLKKLFQEIRAQRRDGRRPRIIGLEQGQAADHPKRHALGGDCLLYTSPSPRDMRRSRMPSSA